MFTNSYLNYCDISDRHKKAIGYTLGSCVAEFTVSPVYMVKTIYQTSEPPKTISEIVKEIYNIKGIKGFYNAIYTAIFSKILSSSLKFLIYNELKHIRGTQNNDLKNNIINGCICGISASTVVHPVDVLTNRLQRFKKLHIGILKRKTLYGGFSQTIIKNLTLYSILFPLFDYNKTITNNNILLSSVMTCCVSSTVLQPIEYLRTRLMAGQHNEVKDIIKTFNIKTQQIEDKPVKHLFLRHYEGIMYNLKNRIQDQLISPKHRIVRKKFQTNEFVLEEIEKIEKMKSPFIIPIAGNLPGIGRRSA